MATENIVEGAIRVLRLGAEPRVKSFWIEYSFSSSISLFIGKGAPDIENMEGALKGAIEDAIEI